MSATRPPKRRRTDVATPLPDAVDALESSGPHRIRVDVSANYVGEQSKPDEGHYAFSYTITIRNEGRVPARLLTRHWVITDANGKVKEVRGEGVVGEQPPASGGRRISAC